MRKLWRSFDWTCRVASARRVTGDCRVEMPNTRFVTDVEFALRLMCRQSHVVVPPPVGAVRPWSEDLMPLGIDAYRCPSSHLSNHLPWLPRNLDKSNPIWWPAFIKVYLLTTSDLQIFLDLSYYTCKVRLETRMDSYFQLTTLTTYYVVRDGNEPRSSKYTNH